jgi:membrane protease YdiL (CAAX protease family)
MSVEETRSTEHPKTWKSRKSAQLMAAVLGVLPLYWALIVLQIRGDQTVSLQGFIFYLAVISPLSLALILFLLRYLCGESPRHLNLKAGNVSGDLLGTLVLSVVIVVASVTSTSLLSRLLPGSASNPSVRNLFIELAGNPKLLALFVGPLLLLGAASEEVARTFLLSRLWKVWLSTVGKSAAVVISAGLFGLVHLYQGPVHALWTGILGLIMALHYVRFGRVLPLVLAHYVTNALQIVVFAANAN